MYAKIKYRKGTFRIRAILLRENVSKNKNIKKRPVAIGRFIDAVKESKINEHLI